MEEKYKEIASKEAEKDRFTTELIEAETLVGLALVIVVIELRHLLNISKRTIALITVLYILFLVWETIRLEETKDSFLHTYKDKLGWKGKLTKLHPSERKKD